MGKVSQVESAENGAMCGIGGDTEWSLVRVNRIWKLLRGELHGQ